MSLAFTAPTATSEMYEVINELVFYSFEDQDDLWDAWAEAALAASDAEDTAAAEKFSGRALTVAFNLAYLSNWITDPAFAKEWSGACLRDYSSKMGGFCLLEQNDSTIGDTTDDSAVTAYNPSDQTEIYNQADNPEILTFRMSDDEFETMESSWEGQTIIEVTADTKDGRCFKVSMDTATNPGEITADSTTIEYLDYPNCTQDGDVWYCQLYMPLRSEQTDGYPRFDYPGVITAYYIASLIPDMEDLSLLKTTGLVYNADGATSMTAFASILVAAVASLAF